MDPLSRYLKPRSRYVPQLCLFAAAMATLAIWLCVQTYRQFEIVAQATRQGDQLRAAQVFRPVAKVNRAELDDKKLWTALKLEREFAWTPLFLAIERASSPDIELLEFQPDKVQRRVLLRGEARDSKALATFLEALAGQGVLKNVHLTHQENVSRERLETVAFEIKAALTE